MAPLAGVVVLLLLLLNHCHFVPYTQIQLHRDDTQGNHDIE